MRFRFYSEEFPEWTGDVYNDAFLGALAGGAAGPAWSDTRRESRAALATYPATREFEMLADWLDLKPKIKIGSFDFSGFDEEEEEEDE